MNRRGLFAGIAALFATRKGARAGAERHVASPLPIRAVARNLVPGVSSAARPLAFKVPADGGQTTMRILAEIREQREIVRARTCLTPGEFTAFMRDRLGDQSMIPVGSMPPRSFRIRVPTQAAGHVDGETPTYRQVARAPDNGEFRYIIRNAAEQFEIGHAVFRDGSCIRRTVIDQAEGEPTLTGLTVFPSLVDIRAGDRLWIMGLAP